MTIVTSGGHGVSSARRLRSMADRTPASAVASMTRSNLLMSWSGCRNGVQCIAAPALDRGPGRDLGEPAGQDRGLRLADVRVGVGLADQDPGCDQPVIDDVERCGTGSHARFGGRRAERAAPQDQDALAGQPARRCALVAAAGDLRPVSMTRIQVTSASASQSRVISPTFASISLPGLAPEVRVTRRRAPGRGLQAPGREVGQPHVVDPPGRRADEQRRSAAGCRSRRRPPAPTGWPAASGSAWTWASPQEPVDVDRVGQLVEDVLDGEPDLIQRRGQVPGLVRVFKPEFVADQEQPG